MEIIKGKLNKPYKVVVYGVEGIGKSTFASKFPDALFVDTEGSTTRMNVARVPKPMNYPELESIIKIVANEKPCKTLVIDTIDWAEALVNEYLCETNSKKSIEDFGYGKGYTMSAEMVKALLNKLEAVIDAGINVVLTAHAQISKFEQPDEQGAYDRYVLKLGQKTSSKTAALVKEWADMVLFANYKTDVITDKNGKKRASGGKRVMYTTHNVAWDAKNRDGLAEMLPFEYESIEHLFAVETPKKAPKKKVKEAPPLPLESPSDDLIDRPHITSPEQVSYDKLGDVNGLPQDLVLLMYRDEIKASDLRQELAQRFDCDENIPFTEIPPKVFEGIVADWDGWKTNIYIASDKLPF